MTIVTVTLNPCVDKTFSVDRVVPDRKLDGSDVRRYPGGGGINVARAARRLGADVRALWTCGGRTGALLAELLDGEGITHEPVGIADETRENLIVDDASCGHQYRFGLPGPLLTEDERVRWLDRLRRLQPAPRYLVFSGSLPGGAPLDWFHELLRAIPEPTRIIADTKKQALRRAIETGVHLIKPNAHELAQITGRELDDDGQIVAAARAIIDEGGAEVVLVSLGRGGALLVTAERAQRWAAPSVPLRSKVGAGDSMVGGVVAALAQGRSLDEAARLGIAAGAAAVMTEGTELCRREDVERLYERVQRVDVPG